MKKSIKLVAFDMDGTVLDSKLRLPKGLFEMIESHPNVKFVVASGRQYYSLLNIFNPIKDKLIFISENGGIIMEKDKVQERNSELSAEISSIFAENLPKYSYLSL